MKSPNKRSYFRVEAIMEAPTPAIVVAVLLMTLIVVAQALARL